VVPQDTGRLRPLLIQILPEVSRFIEYLNPITLPVAYVYEAVVPKGYAVHHLHERTTVPASASSLAP
jgi:hypothetical protein